jgi:excisionase family DNA binding protein
MNPIPSSPPDGCAEISPQDQAPSSSPPPAAVPDLPRLAYSVREAADLLGVSEKSIRRLIDRGLLKASRALRHLLIPRKEIERFLERTTLD